ncbi:hypothetical protein VTO73DRAFT_11313 [Trametes versicolor]
MCCPYVQPALAPSEAARPRSHDDEAADAGRARRALPPASDRVPCTRPPFRRHHTRRRPIAARCMNPLLGSFGDEAGRRRARANARASKGRGDREARARCFTCSCSGAAGARPIARFPLVSRLEGAAGFGSMFAASATPATDDGLAGLVGATYPPHQYSSHSEMIDRPRLPLIYTETSPSSANFPT